MTATGEARVTADAPAFGHLCFPADGQYKMRFVLHVAPVVGVGCITHVAVAQFRFRSGKGVAHPGPDGVVATLQETVRCPGESF